MARVEERRGYVLVKIHYSIVYSKRHANELFLVSAGKRHVVFSVHATATIRANRGQHDASPWIICQNGTMLFIQG